MNRKLVLITAIVCFCGSVGLADQVILKNGDSITGTIVKLTDGTMVFKSNLAGEIQIDLASDAAVVACRAHLLELKIGPGFLQERHLLSHGPGRANVDAPAAHLAGRIQQREFIRRRDRRLGAAPGQGNRAHALDFIAVSRATRAQNAGIGVVVNVRIAIPGPPCTLL